MVEAFKVTGGKEIKGVLEVEGSKNAALPIMIATLIEKGTYILKNVLAFLPLCKKAGYILFSRTYPA